MKVIYFDGFCVLCNNFVKWVIRQDKRKLLKFSTIGGRSYEKLALNHPDLYKVDSVIYDDGHHIYTRGKAVRKIIQDLSTSKVLKVITRTTPLFLLNFYYTLVASARYKLFGKYDVCPTMPPELRDRFLP